MTTSGSGSDGDTDFDGTFRAHYARMVRSLGLACGDAEVAADAVQDAFTRAYTRWNRISGYDDPAAWIRHVALNRVRDHYRHAGRGRRAFDRLARRDETDVAPPELPPESSGVAAALAALPRQQRTAAALFYVEQLSIREVAESMKLSEGAVKYHLHAARAALREKVSQP
ncbi:MAG TPA: sigma-70 family RNA polymerase sigma factor [Acidimicrobiia bacterium]|nr:sigma-70 family RNA polymerase sigma factor [Acidimicrobiia bacterium]